MFHIERLQVYSEQDAVELGLLRPYLSDGASSEPVPEAHLTSIIASPSHEQLVARMDETRHIVGAATLSVISGALTKQKGWLEDFVTDPTVEVRGIGSQIWNQMGVWCIEHNVDLEFTSRESRTGAHDFYYNRGAETRDTTVFKKHFE